MHPKSKEFRKLQTLWYKKLKTTGFEDAEQRDGNLKDWHSFNFVKPSHHSNQREDMDNTAEYYRLAGHFFHHHPFKTLSERQIWELHSDGKSVKQFRSAEVKSKWKVYQILKKLIGEMKESWTQSVE